MKRLLLFLLFATAVWGQGSPLSPVAPVVGNLNAAQASAGTGSCATTNACLPIHLGGNGYATLSLSGTWVGTITIEQSADQGQTWYTIGTQTANGVDSYAVAGMSDLRARVSVYTSGTVAATITYAGGAMGSGPNAVPNPCLSAGVSIKSAIFNITTATTTQLIAGSGTTSIYPCGFSLSMIATVAADTILFESGTGGTCGTATVVATGTYSSGILANGAVVITHPLPLTPAAPGAGFCAITTVGTGPSIAGTVTYVQQ
jgi:hypothetical protein